MNKWLTWVNTGTQLLVLSDRVGSLSNNRRKNQQQPKVWNVQVKKCDLCDDWYEWPPFSAHCLYWLAHGQERWALGTMLFNRRNPQPCNTTQKNWTSMVLMLRVFRDPFISTATMGNHVTRHVNLETLNCFCMYVAGHLRRRHSIQSL